jgi:hypothetical protein
MKPMTNTQRIQISATDRNAKAPRGGALSRVTSNRSATPTKARTPARK